jgi:phosphatidylinositol-3-phosphatase
VLTNKLLSSFGIAVAAIAVAATSGHAAHEPTRPCGTKSSTAYTHVVVIVMENHSYSEIIGSSDAPYINRLAKQCGLATNYYAISHPSLPNYIALTSGTTAGISDDGPPASHRLTNDSIFLQTRSSWRSYEESMPSNCDLTNASSYAVKHNPAAYYTNVRRACSKQDVSLASPPSFSASYTFVTPNLCNDMHDCSVSTGDRWLKKFIPKALASPQYRDGSLVLFLTWDEDSGTNVPLVVVGPTVPAGLRVSTKLTHYALLRTAEELFGKRCLAHACTAQTLRGVFHL